MPQVGALSEADEVVGRLWPRLAAALGVPVAASSLEQAPQIAAMLAPDQQIGILTISAATLGARQLAVAGVPEGTPNAGVDGGSFARTILENRTELDVGAARAEMVAGAVGLVEAHPQIGSVLVECTNMVPYAPDIAWATGRPVFSIYTYLTWFHESLASRGFSG